MQRILNSNVSEIVRDNSLRKLLGSRSRVAYAEEYQPRKSYTNWRVEPELKRIAINVLRQSMLENKFYSLNSCYK